MASPSYSLMVSLKNIFFFIFLAFIAEKEKKSFSYERSEETEIIKNNIREL